MRCGFFLFDPLCHLESWFWGLVSLVPWWGWIIALIVLAGVLWRVAGWPGLVALGTVVGFLLGRRPGPVDDDDIYESGEPRRKKPPAKRRYNPDTNTWEPKQ